MLCFNKDNVTSDYSSLGFCADRQNVDSHLNHSPGGIITLKGAEREQFILQNGTEHMRGIDGRGTRDLCQKNGDDRRHELDINCTGDSQ